MFLLFLLRISLLEVLALSHQQNLCVQVVEVASRKQAQQILKLNSLSTIPIFVQPHVIRLGSSCCLEATGYHPPLRFKDLLWSIPYFSTGEPVRYLSPATASIQATKNFRLLFLQSTVCAKAPHKSLNVIS
ncbi:hypothetical protein AVEN_105784-1 [Araneus ventricosus]|uniref:Secreted protein n=1 Tax=Araneus ventricosus TaxID=182803 RepID=A0A4Y2G2N4_ARAVE|nr:hypothetical protein AVEN_105784-1 [Araneus ventricosus]